MTVDTAGAAADAPPTMGAIRNDASTDHPMTDTRKLDFNLIVVLDALLSEQNLTRAGERIGMTQSAVSASLARLRAIYDDPLLERSGRGFVLTPRAMALIPVVAECVTEVERTLTVLPTFDPATDTRTFVVSASDYVMAELTRALLSLLKSHAPRTRVEFVPLPAAERLTPVDLLRSDVTIAATGRGIPGKRMSLFSDRLVCIADAANPAVHDGAISSEDLDRLPYVRADFGNQITTNIDDMLEDSGITVQPAVTVRGFLPVAFTIARTEWIGWVPERTARRYAASLGLVIVRTPVAPRVLVEAAHWHPSKSDDPALTWFVATLREAAALVEFGDDVDDAPESETSRTA